MTLFATSEDLPSYIFYKKFDEVDTTTYYSLCKEKISTKSDENLIKLCSKVLKNLNILAENQKEDSFLNKRCDDLKYWIGEQLIQNHDVKEKRLKDSNIYISLYTPVTVIMSREHINDKCSLDYDDITIEEKRRRKNLYDYYENYEKLEQIITQNGKKCSKEHHEYLAKCVSLYNETKNFCTPGRTYVSEKCPSFFNDSKIYSPGKNLSEMPCELEVQSEASSVLVSETQISANEDVGRTPLSGVTMSGDRSDTDASSEPSPSLSNTVMLTSIPVLGSCFFFFILYRV